MFKKNKQFFYCFGIGSLNYPSGSRLTACLLVGQVDAQFGWRDKVFPGALRDHHAGLLVEHGGYLWWGFGYWQILGRLGVFAALEIIGDVAVLSQEGKQLQQKVAEVFADAEPPCQKTELGMTFLTRSWT